MKLRVLLLLTISLLFGACEKETGNLRFYGVIIDARDSSPMPGVKIEYFGTASNGLSYVSDSVWTDNSGVFHFSFPQTGGGYCQIYPIKKGYSNYLNQRVIQDSYRLESNFVTTDTLTIWRNALLTIDLNGLDSTYQYLITSSIDRETTPDSLELYLPLPHAIDPDAYEYSLDGSLYNWPRNTITYLYDFSPRVNIFWQKFRRGEYDTIFGESGEGSIPVDLIPQDTVFISLE